MRRLHSCRREDLSSNSADCSIMYETALWLVNFKCLQSILEMLGEPLDLPLFTVTSIHSTSCKVVCRQAGWILKVVGLLKRLTKRCCYSVGCAWVYTTLSVIKHGYFSCAYEALLYTSLIQITLETCFGSS